MPRRRPDVVHEYRISLSDFERKKVEEIQTLAAANVGLDAATNVMMAAGTALAGGGALLAAFVLMRWKAPEIIAELQDKANGILDSAVDGLVPGTPAQDRRRAQEFAERRGQLAKEEATFCSFTSEKYDEQQCSVVQQKKDQYFADLEAFQTEIRTRYDAAGQELIYYGLGDINPNFIDGDSTASYDDYVKAGWLGVWTGFRQVLF